jgi:hypothetical protein
MNCKYCHLNTHYIDKCPTIICKICKGIGHPQWLCNETKKSPKNGQNIKLEKKYNYSEDIKKKSKTENSYKTISYYLKLKNEEWGSLIDI